MASVYYSLNRGDTEFSVVEGATTASAAIEIQVDLTKLTVKSEILQLLDMLENHILKNASAALGS